MFMYNIGIAIAKADLALYKGKENGRNQIVVFKELATALESVD